MTQPVEPLPRLRGLAASGRQQLLDDGDRSFVRGARYTRDAGALARKLCQDAGGAVLVVFQAALAGPDDSDSPLPALARDAGPRRAEDLPRPHPCPRVLPVQTIGPTRCGAVSRRVEPGHGSGLRIAVHPRAGPNSPVAVSALIAGPLAVAMPRLVNAQGKTTTTALTGLLAAAGRVFAAPVHRAKRLAVTPSGISTSVRLAPPIYGPSEGDAVRAETPGFDRDDDATVGAPGGLGRRLELAAAARSAGLLRRLIGRER